MKVFTHNCIIPRLQKRVFHHTTLQIHTYLAYFSEWFLCKIHPQTFQGLPLNFFLYRYFCNESKSMVLSTGSFLKSELFSLFICNSVVSNIEPLDTCSFPLGKVCICARSMFKNLMLGDARARKCSKTGARTRSILEKFAFDTTLTVNTLDGLSSQIWEGQGSAL